MPVKLKIKPLIDNEVTDKNYYEDHMYTTNSMLKTFLDKCPKFFEWRMEYPIKATAPMKFGNGVNSPNRWLKEDIDNHVTQIRMVALSKGAVSYEPRSKYSSK